MIKSIIENGDIYSFDIPEVVRQTIGAPLYKIVMNVTPKDQTQDPYQLVFLKGYSDVRKLHEILERYHHAILRPGTFFPLPEKPGVLERNNLTVIEERQMASKRFFSYILEHIYLRTHQAFFDFFQTGQRVEISEARIVHEPSNQPTSSTVVIITPSSEDLDQKTAEEPLIKIDQENEPVNGVQLKIDQDLLDLHFD